MFCKMSSSPERLPSEPETPEFPNNISAAAMVNQFNDQTQSFEAQQNPSYEQQNFSGDWESLFDGSEEPSGKNEVYVS